MTTTTATDAIKSLSAELEEHHRSFTERAKELIRPAIAEYFEAHPKVESFAWSQYTPYFMDGDECIFGVNSDAESITVNGEDYYDSGKAHKETGYRDDADGKYKYRDNPDYDADIEAAYQGAAELVSAVPDDLMKAMFGDHIQVTAHRDGRIETDEYSHD